MWIAARYLSRISSSVIYLARLYINFFEHFGPVLLACVGLSIKQTSITEDHGRLFKFFQSAGNVLHDVLEVILQPHQVNLEKFDLPGFKLREIEGQSRSSNDGSCFWDDEDGGSNAFEGVIDAVDSFAFASTPI